MPFYVAPFLSLLYVLAAQRFGDAALCAALPLLAGVFSIGDAAFGRGPGSAPISPRWRDRILPWLYIPAQIAVTLWSVIVSARATTDAAMLVDLALAIGTVAGIFGMLAAHEMIHSPSRAERGLGVAMLAAMTYMHFRVSHVWTHHRLAATLDDAATARRGESFYRFLVRSVAGQLRAALDMERSRAARRGHGLTGNRVYRYGVISAAIYLAMAATLGLKAVGFFALQSVVAIVVLELFNYVVHYGLLRRVLPDGRTEPLGAQHSWNAPQRFTNWALMNGGHHSEHHRRPSQAYAALARAANAPELPAGYGGTMVMALVPPLWRAIMHPRLDRLSRLAAGQALP